MRTIGRTGDQSGREPERGDAASVIMAPASEIPMVSPGKGSSPPRSGFLGENRYEITRLRSSSIPLRRFRRRGERRDAGRSTTGWRRVRGRRRHLRLGRKLRRSTPRGSSTRRGHRENRSQRTVDLRAVREGRSWDPAQRHLADRRHVGWPIHVSARERCIHLRSGSRGVQAMRAAIAFLSLFSLLGRPI